MSIGFFIVGAVIFSIYIYFLCWNISYNNKKQSEENKSSKIDLLDSDGNGNWGRFIPSSKNK
jgi:hypothetical protein